MRVGANPSGGRPEASESDLAKLLLRVAARDEGAFKALYRETSARLYGLVFRILPRGDAAAEALQDTFVRIWQKAGDFDPGKGAALAWMAAIARNRALDEVRRVRPVSLEDMPEDFEPAAEPVDPLQAREKSERLGALIACLERLEDEKRAIVLLAYYHGASREALAKRFGRPVPTIKTWLRRSLAELRECLSS
jgi:RNA polymerase sigma-70 factor, ECF subfamily